MAIPESIGISFAPTREASELAPQRARNEGLQEAIRVLSLHVPQVLGGRPVAAGELLRASGGGDPVSAVVESVLRSVMGGQAAAGPTVGAAGGPAIPGATRAIGTAPAAPDTSTMLAQAVRTLAQSRALPRITPFRPGFGETGFLRQAPGESAFEAIQRHTRPETRQAQLAGPIARSLEFQEQAAQEAPEFLPQFRPRLSEIEASAKLPPGFLGPLSAPAPARTLADVLREIVTALGEPPVPLTRGRPVAF